MLEADLAALKIPYTLDPQRDDAPRDAFARALGLFLQPVDALHRAVRDDLDTNIGGVRWWGDQLGAKQRISIGDYLHEAIGSIGTNLIDARLHQLEGRAASRDEMDRHADDLTIVGNEVIPRIQPPTCALDDLPRSLADLHRAGFFRAVGSAVDCLGAAVIGVAGLSTNILRSDIGKALKSAAKPNEPSALAPEAHRLLCDARDAAGPAGWLSWATDYRNMLIHRARRLSLHQYVPREPLLLGPNGVPILRVDAVEQLARDPGRSDIEAFLAMGWAPAKDDSNPIPPVLEETAATTIDGIYKSTRTFINDVATELGAMWERRRTNPQLVTQPAAQWPMVPSTDTTGFGGYGKREVPFEADALTLNPILGLRLAAAQISGDVATTWNELD